MLDIVKAPAPILSQKSKPVGKIDRSVLKLIQKMKKSLATANDPIGVGLAAPQVGKPLNIFIAKPSEKSGILTFINPKITKKIETGERYGKEKHTKLEGCLSLPSVWGEVERAYEIKVEYQDETGKLHKRKLAGFLSTIFQHESDHLNGVLFPKRVLEQKGTLYKSEKDERGEDVFEELKI